MLPYLEDLIEYQKSLIILPSYDNQVGKRVEVQFDWIRYFTQARQPDSVSPSPESDFSSSLPEPEPMQGMMIEISDESWTDVTGTHSLDWGTGNEKERWAQWIRKMIFVRNSSAINNFQKLRKIDA